MNYNGRIFQGRSNSEAGEVGTETRFHYRQDGNRLYGEYSGGKVVLGHLLGNVNPDGSLEFLYHHINNLGELKAGKCKSVPGNDPDGTLVLKESWQWLTGQQESGQSEVVEVKNDS